MEMVLTNNFAEMDVKELNIVDGGTGWGVVGGVLTVIGGVAQVVGGGALLGIPEPTFTTKVAGGALIVTGIGTTLGGVAQIASNI